MTARHTVKLSANFEYNLERFPGMGRLLLERPGRSVETENGIARLTKQLDAIARGGELREYLMAHYLLLYAQIQARCICSRFAATGSYRLIWQVIGWRERLATDMRHGIRLIALQLDSAPTRQRRP